MKTALNNASKLLKDKISKNSQYRKKFEVTPEFNN
jgi:hypothetical protein